MSEEVDLGHEPPAVVLGRPPSDPPTSEIPVLPGQTPPPGMHAPGTAATRYLSAGAYLDERFRNSVLREVLGQKHRAVAPSYGIDVVPVIRHALVARRRDLIRNLVLGGTLVGMLVVEPPVVVGVIFLVVDVRMLSQAVRAYRQGRLGYFFARLLLFGFLVSVPLAVLGTVLGLATGSLFGSDGSGDGFGGFDDSGSLGDSGEVTSSGGHGGAVRLVLFLILIGVALWALVQERLANQNSLVNELAPGRFDPARAPAEPPQLRDRLAFLAEAQRGNVTYYARGAGDHPFVGSGLLDEPWHLAIPLSRPREKQYGEPEPAVPRQLKVEDLYEAMRSALVRLADPKIEEDRRILGLSLQDRLFVPGLLPAGSPLLEPRSQLPVHRVRKADMRAMERSERNRATHYLTARINAWEGELEVTVFLYFNVRGDTMYVEFVGALLPSINDRFHDVDTQRRVDGGVVGRTIARAVLDLPMSLLRCPARIWRLTRDTVRSRADLYAQASDINTRLAFDYGASTSVRELGADWDTEQFFQRLDGQRYVRTVERRVVGAISEVLRDFGYDTGEFVRRTQTIIDSSQHTHIEHSTFNNSAIATGSGSAVVGNLTTLAPVTAPSGGNV
jgi:hypothetical protein